MEGSTALTIRTRIFLAGIVLGAIIGFFYEQSLRSVIIGGIVGGIYLGAIGEGFVGGDIKDSMGSGFFLGFVAGIVVAITIRPFSLFSTLQPFLWGVLGIVFGLLGYLVGRMVKFMYGRSP